VELLESGIARFYHPDGTLMPEVPSLPKPPVQSLESLRETNLRHGIDISGKEGQPKWGYAPIDWYWVDVPIQNQELRRRKKESSPLV
jgi:hypothetical protein